MDKKVFTEKIIVATSQYYTTESTRRLFNSLKQDGIPFTFLVVFDGTSREKIKSLEDIADISIVFKTEIHSLPELFNSIINVVKGTDAQFLFYTDNDLEYKEGSFKSMVSLLGMFDIISPVKIDHDRKKFDEYFSAEDPVEVIGWNDCAWFSDLSKIPFNAYDRFYGPIGFEQEPLQFKLWKDSLSFAVDRRAIAFHYCSQDTPFCFNPEDRKKYSDEWDKKAEYFKNNNGPSAKWFFDNVVMNAEAIRQFGFPVYVK